MKPKLPKFIGLALIGVLAAVACVQSPGPRVGVKNVAAELVFGIPPVEEPVAPPGAFPEVPEEIDLTDFEDGSFTPSSAPPPLRPRCPQAGPNDFPEREAPPAIDGKPKEGRYNWRVQGTQRIQGIPFPVRLGEFEERRVQRVMPFGADPQNFLFETVQRKPGTGGNTFVVSTFVVDSTNPSPTLRGILLARTFEVKQGETTGTTFDPEPNIMYLPLPVQQGSANRFETVGVDPRSFQAIRHIGFVKERRDVDACGKMIQSWLVDAEYFISTSSPPQTKRINFDYAIATHFGGLIVFEHIQSSCEASNADGSCTPAPEIEYDANIGQTEPS